MKTTLRIYFGIAIFFALFSVIYPVWIFLSGSEIEWVGTIAIPLTMIMWLLIASFLFLNYRRQAGGVLPEDNDLADVDDGDTDMGYYLPWSWWPFFAGAAGGVAMLSMAVGPWLALFALGIVLITFIGWFFEPVRGAYRR